MSKLTDEEIITIITNGGNPQIFGELYDRYSNKVYRKCISFTSDSALAKDLAHDIFMKVFLSLSKFKGNAKFSTWLYRITYNHCVDYVKKRNRMRFEPIDEELIISESMDDKNEKVLLDLRAERLQEVLELIRAESKMILLMKYQDDSSIADIMEMTGKKESAVKMAIKRAKLEAVTLYNEKFGQE